LNADLTADTLAKPCTATDKSKQYASVKEKYQLTWPVKREATQKIGEKSYLTLRPQLNERINFYSTQNLFIEGDNLQALKLLQETYLNKVKLIYIDPPYNT